MTVIYTYEITHVDGSVNSGELKATNMMAALNTMKMFNDITVATEVSIVHVGWDLTGE